MSQLSLKTGVHQKRVDYSTWQTLVLGSVCRNRWKHFYRRSHRLNYLNREVRRLVYSFLQIELYPLLSCAIDIGVH